MATVPPGQVQAKPSAREGVGHLEQQPVRVPGGRAASAVLGVPAEAVGGRHDANCSGRAPGDGPAAFGQRRDEIAQWEPQWFLLEAEFELYAARNPEVRERIAKRQQQTREVIEDALRRHIDELGLKPAYPVEELAKLIVAAGDGMSLMALNNPEGTDTSELMRILLEVLARGATAA